MSRTMSTEQDVEDDKTSVQGESLLLPLLQELLNKKAANAAPLNRSCSNHSSEGSVTAAADSGTESGEDLRLIAAGLCDSVDKAQNAEPLGAGLLNEVQNALAKLATSLQSDNSNEVEIDPIRKSALMDLIMRLQANLVVPSRAPVEIKLPNLPKRFPKSKSRQHRHTVGVSSEELAAARKLIGDLDIGEMNDKDTYIPKEQEIYKPEVKPILQKQNSDGNVGLAAPNYSKQIQNTSPKPFVNSNKPPIDIQSYKLVKNIMETNYETELDNKRDLFKKSLSYEHETSNDKIPITVSISADSINKTKSGYENYQTVLAKQAKQNLKLTQDSDDEDDTSTLKQDTIHNLNRMLQPSLHYDDLRSPVKLVAPARPTYETENVKSSTRTIKERFESNERSRDVQENKTPNRYSSKKLKMKRANTIDIPKPANFIFRNEDDDSVLDTGDQKRNYLALRGPIRVGSISQKPTVVPSFEPRTENDKKFMAFIQKHNSNPNMNSLWNNKPPETKPSYSAEHNWNKKFGNIKTIFESDQRCSSPMMNSAKKFWQTAESNKNIQPPAEPKISRREPKPLQNTVEQKPTSTKLPWTAPENNNKVVTGSLRVESSPQIKQVNNQMCQGKQYKFIPQPLPVNKFSHAPMSAFKPPPKKVTISTNQKVEKQLDEPTTPLYLYSPKQLQFTDSEESKQASSTPWANQTEHRVLNIVASKFENVPKEVQQPVKHKSTPHPQKPHHESFKNDSIQKATNKYYDKLDTAAIDKQKHFSEETYQKAHNKVRRLSGEFDSKTMKQKIDPKYDGSQKPKRKLSDDYTNVANKNNVYIKNIPFETVAKPKSSKTKQSVSKEGHSQNKNKTHTVYDKSHAKEQHYLNDSYEYKHQQPKEYQQSYEHQYPYEHPVPYQNQYELQIYEHQNSLQQQTPYDNQLPIQYQQNYPYDNNERQNEIHYKNMPSQQVYNNESRQQNMQYTQQQNNTDNNRNIIPLVVYNNTSKNLQDHTPYVQNISDQHYPNIQSQPEEQYYRNYTPEPQLHSPKYGEDIHKKIYDGVPYAPQVGFIQKPYYEDDRSYTPEVFEVNRIYEAPKSTERNLREEREYENSPNLYNQQPQMYPEPQVVHKVYGLPDNSNKNVLPQKKPDSLKINETKQQPLLKIFDFPSPEQSPVPVIKKEPPTPPLTEYKAVSKIMVGPVSQQAVTVQQKTPKTREEHDTAANHLQNILQKRSSSKDSEESLRLSVTPTSPQERQDKSGSVSPRRSVSPRIPIPHPNTHNNQLQKPPIIHVNNTTITSESYEIEKDGERVLSTKLQIPVDNRSMQYINSHKEDQFNKPSRLSPSNALSKSDSWHQLVQDQVNSKPSPRASPRASPQARYALQKAKSSHSLAVPKQFEAGIAREEVEQKKKTVQAYFGVQPLTKTSSVSNMQEEKVAQKTKKTSHISKYSSKSKHALSRSQTMPDVAHGDSLFDDIDDVDAEFENIFKASVCK